MIRQLARFTSAWVVALLLGAGWAGSSAAQTPDRQVGGLSIFVHYGDPDAWDSLWAALPDRVQRVRQHLGDEVLETGEIHVVSDINRFFADRGDSVRAPRWAQAVALPARDLIVLRMPDPNPVGTMTHELSHLAVHDASGGRHVPLWFLEGFAQFQAEEWGVQRSVSIGQAALFDNTIPFDTLDTEFPPHALSAGLAYAQSFHFVRRLIEEHGAEAIQLWLSRIAQGKPWRPAFREAFGVDAAIEFRAWRDSVRVWYGWIPAIISVTSLWTGLAVLALWARRRVRRRRAAQLAALEAEERELYPPDPDDDLFT